MTVVGDESRGAVITFYSFKGGVGRSMALANVAEILSQRGHSVICCDWDLEAPGLEQYLALDENAAEEYRARPGLIDLIDDFKAAISRRPDAKPHGDPRDDEIEFRGVRLPRPLSRTFALPAKEQRRGEIRLLTAGARHREALASYADGVRRFDWRDFYENWAGDAFVSLLREDLLGAADYVLIDSRTGVTELGGVCTQFLADIVVLLTNATRASVAASKFMASSMRSPDLAEVRAGRPLLVLPVAARVERTAEKQELADFRANFVESFDKYVATQLEDAASFLVESEIPYVPFYGFAERVVAREHSATRQRELFRAYDCIATALVDCAAGLATGGAEAVAPTRDVSPEANQPLIVIRDFEIHEYGIVLEDLIDNPPPGVSRVVVPGLEGSGGQGEVFRDLIAPEFGARARVIALVDLPNANVGFEVGFALGRGAPVALAVIQSRLPEWLQRPPLNGFVAERAPDADALRRVATSDWIAAPEQVELDQGGSTLFLCPELGVGKSLRHRAARERPEWAQLPASGWSLRDLPRLLRGVGTVVWILAPFPRGSDERDGADNAAAAIVAGFAKACGARLHVLRHVEARAVVDVAVWESRFATLAEFAELLPAVDPAPAAAPPDPFGEYRTYLRAAHARLVPFFPEAGRALLDEVFVELDVDVEHELDREERTGKESDKPVHGAGRFALRDLMGLNPSSGIVSTGRWVVLGDPGAGKTTAARHLVWELAGEPAAPVPVYVSLPRIEREKKHPFEVAEDDLRVARGDRAASGLREALDAAARQGDGVWVFLDGLDEVEPDALASVRERIADFAATLPRTAIAVLSRRIGYRAISTEFRSASLRELSQASRQELLVRWLGRKRAADTWQRLQTRPALGGMTGNPLMLTLVASLALARPDLPSSRLRLYEDATRLLLERGFGTYPKGVRDPHAAQPLLAALALYLQHRSGVAWPREELEEALYEVTRESSDLDRRWQGTWSSRREFLEDVAKNSGILAPHDGEREPWRFLHRQLREFLAAQALVARGDGAWRDLVSNLDEEGLPRWSETLGLVCGMASDPLGRLRELRIRPGSMLEFLLDLDDWDGLDLARVAANWVEQGCERGEITDVVMRLVTPEASTERLAYAHFALESVGARPARAEFFAACGRPVDRVPELPFVQIEGGTFRMGSPADEPERSEWEGPQHEVSVGGFELCATAVTNEAWAKFEPDFEPRSWQHGKPEELARLPVVEVSWWSAYLFTRWAGVRLPSEAEWEYACRAGTTTPFWFGETITTDQVNFDGNYPYADGEKGEYRKRTVPVGSLPPNGYGLYEMHGNVWEWCEDTWHDSYDGAPCDGSAWVDVGASLRVVRGGSWINDARYCRSAYRVHARPGLRDSDRGFRPARS